MPRAIVTSCRAVVGTVPRPIIIYNDSVGKCPLGNLVEWNGAFAYRDWNLTVVNYVGSAGTNQRYYCKSLQSWIELASGSLFSFLIPLLAQIAEFIKREIRGNSSSKRKFNNYFCVSYFFVFLFFSFTFLPRSFRNHWRLLKREMHVIIILFWDVNDLSILYYLLLASYYIQNWDCWE